MLNAKFDAGSLLYLLSCFECDGHTVHMLDQQCLPPPLSTVRSSLFMHVHSSSLSLAARLHQHGVICSHYVNNGWTSSRQTSLYILRLSVCSSGVFIYHSTSQVHKTAFLSFVSLDLCVVHLQTTCPKLQFFVVFKFFVHFAGEISDSVFA